MSINGPKIYGEFLGITITQTTVSSFVVMILLCVAGFFLGRKLKKRKPGRLQILTEKLVQMLYDLVEQTMGSHNLNWTPYIGALFLSSFGGSLIGMTGFLRSTTSDLSTTIVWAIMTTVLVWASSIRSFGFVGWLKGFTQPVAVMLPMNIISEIAKPVAMAFRHFGNIMGGSVLTALLYSALAVVSAKIIGLITTSTVVIAIIVAAIGLVLGIIGFKKKKFIIKLFAAIFFVVGIVGILEVVGVFTNVPIFDVGIPALLSLYFDIFAGGVQALVFSLLTMVYISDACPPPEERRKKKSDN